MALVTSGMLRSQGYRTLQTRSAPARPQVCRAVVAQVGWHSSDSCCQSYTVAAASASAFTLKGAKLQEYLLCSSTSPASIADSTASVRRRLGQMAPLHQQQHSRLSQGQQLHQLPRSSQTLIGEQSSCVLFTLTHQQAEGHCATDMHPARAHITGAISVCLSQFCMES
jgi:hypothetical protein